MHLASCLVCRRRRDGFLAAVEQAREDDPGEETRERVRAEALARWGEGGARRSTRRWWLAAAAVLLLVLLPVWHERSQVEQAAFNTDAVLAEVDAVLASDPLAVMASEAVVDVVAPANGAAGEGGV
jgi:hypothetical protein